MEITPGVFLRISQEFPSETTVFSTLKTTLSACRCMVGCLPVTITSSKTSASIAITKVPIRTFWVISTGVKEENFPI